MIQNNKWANSKFEHIDRLYCFGLCSLFNSVDTADINQVETYSEDIYQANTRNNFNLA